MSRLSRIWLAFFASLALAQGPQALAAQSSSVIRFGTISASLSPEERLAIDRTFVHLSKSLPQYEIRIRQYPVANLETAIKNNEVDFFLATSGFYRRVYHRGLRDIASLTSPRVKDPNFATGTVFMVAADSPIRTVEDLRGKVAATSWHEGFTGYFIPMAEIARRGFDPDRFFSRFVYAGTPMRRLLEAVERKEADVALARSCTVEELMDTDPQFVKRFRPIGLKQGGGLACMHSTDLYPYWTIGSTSQAPWKMSRDVSWAILSMPMTEQGYQWGVISDLTSVDEMYKTLRMGPYRYLRITSVSDFFRHYWMAFFLIALIIVGLMLHSRRAQHLVDERTRELSEAMRKEAQAREIADRSQKRMEAFERASVVGAMSSLIAHELNGPLSAISNCCRALHRRFEDDPPESVVIRALDLIGKQCQKASDIVGKSRGYARQRTMQYRAVEAVGLARRTFELRGASAGSVRMHFESDIAQCNVCWDELELELCINNLLKNAIEAVAQEPDPQVDLSIVLEDGFLMLRVTDNGSQITPSLAGEQTPLTTTKTEGLGIGLLIVSTLCERASAQMRLQRQGGRTVASLRVPVINNNQEGERNGQQQDA